MVIKEYVSVVKKLYQIFRMFFNISDQKYNCGKLHVPNYG